jgi:DNA-directed RNA polymerase specialized sigma24 family protein
MLEDRLLILRFNRGDRSVLHRIYDKYKDDLATLAAALLMDVSSAEDVVHDVFISFLSLAGHFKLTSSLKGYLATCVANRARNVTRRPGGMGVPLWMMCPRWPAMHRRRSRPRSSARSSDD